MEWLLTGKPTTVEREVCDGIPLSYEEGDFIAMYRLLPDPHRHEAFDFVYFKYKREVEREKGYTYSSYTAEDNQRSGPGDDLDVSAGTA